MIFFHNRRHAGDLRTKAGDLGGGHKPTRPVLGGRPSRLVSSPWLPCPRFFAYIFPKIPEKIRRSSKVLFCLRKIPSGARSGALPEGGFGHGGLLHQHHCLYDDAWVVHHRPLGPYLVSRWLLLSLGSSIQSSPWSSWRSIRCNLLWRCVCRDPMNCGFVIRLSMIYIWFFVDFLYAWFDILVSLSESWVFLAN